MTWMISFGSYGGFGWYNGFMVKRLLLGWMAITYFAQDDEFLGKVIFTPAKHTEKLVGFSRS